jgi:hypothetical protein
LLLPALLLPLPAAAAGNWPLLFRQLLLCLLHLLLSGLL